MLSKWLPQVPGWGSHYKMSARGVKGVGGKAILFLVSKEVDPCLWGLMVQSLSQWMGLLWLAQASENSWPGKWNIATWTKPLFCYQWKGRDTWLCVVSVHSKAKKCLIKYGNRRDQLEFEVIQNLSLFLSLSHQSSDLCSSSTSFNPGKPIII